jgi:cytochrome P450
MMTDFSVATLDALEPGNFFPLPLGGDTLRQISMLGVVASWGARRPFYIRQNGILCVMCGRMKDVREVFLDAGRFTVIGPKRPGYHVFDMFGGLESVLQMDGERHSRIRKLMNPSFTPNAIEAMKTDLHRIIGEKLDRIAEIGPEFDAMRDFCQGLLEQVVLAGSFKLSRAHCDVFLRMQDEMTRLSSFVPGEPFPQSFTEAVGAVHTAMTEIIRERRANPGSDPISNLITALEDGDKLTDGELSGQISSIATAGIGTTANVLAGVLLMLCRHPAQLDLLKSRPELVDSAIDECLRYHGPGIVAFVRFATRTTEVGGTRIPKDMPVYVSPQAAGFDPTEIEDPFRFDITRKSRGTLAFGSGVHHCIGLRLGRLILRTALLAILQRFPDIQLVDPAFQPEYRGFTGELQAVTMPMRTHAIAR